MNDAPKLAERKQVFKNSFHDEEEAGIVFAWRPAGVLM